MSGIIIFSTLSVFALAGIIASVRVTMRDGYHREPTRSL